MVRSIRAVIEFTDAVGRTSTRDIVCEALDRDCRWVWEGPRPARGARYRFDRIASARLHGGVTMTGLQFGEWLADKLPIFSQSIEEFAHIVGLLARTDSERQRVVAEYCAAIEASSEETELAQLWAAEIDPETPRAELLRNVSESFHRNIANRLIGQMLPRR